METCSSILAWRIPWTGSHGAWWVTVRGVTKIWTRLKRLSAHAHRLDTNHILIFLDAEAQKQVRRSTSS